ncbi:hypothetical protein [Nonomuraea sp. NPDC050691]
MESLGKQRTSDGQPVSCTTGGIVFGDEGAPWTSSPRSRSRPGRGC